MSHTVPCPDSASSHKEHNENSREYRTCSERETRRKQELRRIAIEHLLEDQRAEVPSTAGSAPTFMQKLAASANPIRRNEKSDGPSFGG